MRRREFVTVVVGAAVTWPVVARAQQPQMPVIGFLRNTAPEQSASLVVALRKGLGEAGYIEGTNLSIEYRWGAGRQEMRGMADELVRHKCAVIVGGGDAAILAAKAATAQIPVVFAIGNDPATPGLVESLNHPGGNVTGVTFLSNT